MAQELHVKIIGDTADYERALGKAQKQTSGFSAGLKKAFKPAVAALAGIGAAAGKAVLDASDLDEQLNKTGAVFGESAREIHEWSRTTAEAFGISRVEALEYTGVFGNMLVPMGLARDQAGQMSVAMVELAADMASFNNASPEDVLAAIQSGLAGQSEPLRQFGVFLDAARIKAEALALGLVQEGEALDAAAKAQATYSIILKDTADAQGDFAATSDSLANQQRILQARLSDVSAELGAALLPVAQKFASLLQQLIGFVRENSGLVKGLAIAFGVLATAVVAANVAMRAAALANPWTAAAVAIIAAIALIIKHWDTVVSAVRTGVDKIKTFLTETVPAAFRRVLSWVSSNWPKIATIISGPFAPLVALATDAFGIRSKLVGAFKGLLQQVTGVMRSLFQTVQRFLIDTFSNAFRLAVDIGRAIVDGIVSGLGGLFSAVKGKIESGLKGALNAINPFSPIEEGAERLIGRPIVEGVLKGVEPLERLLGDALNEGLRRAIERGQEQVQQARDKFAAAFQSVADKILRAFDAQTAAMETASERELRLIAERRKAEDQAKAVADAEAALDKARREGASSEELAELEQRKFRALEDVWRTELEKRAEEERRNLEERRANRRTALEERLENLRVHFEKEGVATNKAMRKLRGVLAAFDVDFGRAGANIGIAFVRALKAALAQAAGASGDIGAIIRRIAKQIKIPQLAHGGIVTRPTLALVGEAGPEAVVPLTGPRAAGVGGMVVNINIEGPITSRRDVAMEIRDELLRFQRDNPHLWGR